MENVADIEIRQTVIVVNSESWNIWSTIAGIASTIQKIDCVGTRLGIGIGGQEIQTLGKPFFHLRLKPMIETVAVGGCITGVPAEIRERKGAAAGIGKSVGRRTPGCTVAPGGVGQLRIDRQNRGGIVRSRKVLQVTGQGGNVPSLHR